MAYVLDSTTIRNPYELEEVNSTQFAEQRTLSGAVQRDYFGSNKRIWRLTYQNAKKADYDAINAIYTSYLASGTAKTWQITETNYSISTTNVHIELLQRGFSIHGTDYISDFELRLIEA